MHRRRFLKSAALCVGAGCVRGWAQAAPVTLTIDRGTRLGAQGVIRVGGNTADYAGFRASGPAVAAPKSSVVDERSLRELGGFLRATDWSLIWGLNLGNGSVDEAIAEARAMTAAVGDRLLAFEIGNEPDLFVHEGHRAQYGYAAYLAEYRRYKAAVRAALPHAAFAGPDAALATDWVVQFARDEGHDLRLLTHHYYREGQSPRSTMAKLLNPDPGLAAMLEEMNAASRASGVPYRICETNSFSGGGRPGVSDRFGAALWALDYLCVLAWHGAEGVNMETGVNQLGFVSSYSPIAGDRRGPFVAAPEYYGMLAFAEGCRGERVASRCEAGGRNVTAYVTEAEGAVSAVIVNKERSESALEVRAKGSARVMRLTAPNVASRTGVTLGGAAVGPDGRWRGRWEPLPVTDGVCRVAMPAASAAIVRMDAE